MRSECEYLESRSIRCVSPHTICRSRLKQMAYYRTSVMYTGMWNDVMFHTRVNVSMLITVITGLWNFVVALLSMHGVLAVHGVPGFIPRLDRAFEIFFLNFWNVAWCMLSGRWQYSHNKYTWPKQKWGCTPLIYHCQTFCCVTEIK